MATLASRTRALTQYKRPKVSRLSGVNRYTNWRLIDRSIPDFDIFTSQTPHTHEFLLMWNLNSIEKYTARRARALSGKAVKEFVDIVNKPSIEVLHVDNDAVENLLGNQGKYVLNKVINLIQDIAQEKNWPLENIEITYKKDSEVKGWEYIILMLAFNCSFEDADKYLTKLYSHLDELATKLSNEEAEILAELIFLDIKTN